MVSGQRRPPHAVERSATESMKPDRLSSVVVFKPSVALKADQCIAFVISIRAPDQVLAYIFEETAGRKQRTPS